MSEIPSSQREKPVRQAARRGAAVASQLPALPLEKPGLPQWLPLYIPRPGQGVTQGRAWELRGSSCWVSS